MNEKGKLFKGGYLVEVAGHDRNKVLWEVFNNHVIEEATDHDDDVFQPKMSCLLSFSGM